MTIVAIDETISLPLAVYDPDTGRLANADAPINFAVYEGGGETAIETGTITSVHASRLGAYMLTRIPTTGAGYENGKSYDVLLNWEVGGVERIKWRSFRVDSSINSRSSQTSVNSVASDASDAKNAAEDIQAIVEDATNGNAAIKTAVGTRASQTTVDGLTAKLPSGGQNMAGATDLAAKATQASVDALPQTADLATKEQFWATLLSAITTSSTIGKLIKDNLDAPVSTAGGELDAAGIRGAIGMENADLDTQLAAVIDAAEDAKAAAEAVEGAVAPSVTADRVPKQCTFFVGSEGTESRNIVKLNPWTTGTRTLAYDLEELLSQSETTILAVNTVTVVKGATSITTSGLRMHQNKLIAQWDVEEIDTDDAGTYVVTVTVTTLDDNTIVLTGTLEVG